MFNAYAAYYDCLYQDKNYKSESGNINALLKTYSVGNKVLDLGCGTGRHAEFLAQLGFNVTGVDLSDFMLEKAKSSMSTNIANKNSFLQGDVRDVRLNQRFDAVISLFHVASYQIFNKDIKAMFETAAVHLIPGGVFIFDFWYGPGVLADKPSVRIKRMSDDNCNVLRIAEPVMRINENIVDVNYTIDVEDKNTKIKHSFEEKHCMRYFFKPELELMLETAGFRLETFFDCQTYREPDESSWTATLVAVRHERSNL